MKDYTKASYDSSTNQRELDNLQVAYRAACEAIVLLENDGALPLANRKIALFGNGASRTIKGGTGSGEVNERHSVSVMEGLNAGRCTEEDIRRCCANVIKSIFGSQIQKEYIDNN